LAGYTGVGISRTNGLFAKVEGDGWTGIAFVNIEGTAASVTLTAYDDSGAVVATEAMNVAANAKEVGQAENLFTQGISTATCISYSSDREVVGFQLNGSSGGMMLDGLPALAGAAPPVAGEWNGSAGFGELSFTVDSTSTGITEITWNWLEFTCGGVTKNGSETSAYVTPLPIINAQFPTVTLSNFVTADPSSEFSMSGTFDASGTYASGTYEAVVFGTTCSGTWNASP
jgi:hypothetical protein